MAVRAGAILCGSEGGNCLAHSHLMFLEKIVPLEELEAQQAQRLA